MTLSDRPATLHRPRNPDAPEVSVAPSVSAAAGKPATVPVRVVHRGRTPARIRVTVFGLDSRWAPPPLDLGILQPGDSAAITLTILPERGSLGASYPFTIAAEASSAAAMSTAAGRARPVVGVAESTLVLDAAERVSMSLSPSTPSAVFSKGIRVNITNPSGAERTFTLVPDAAAGANLSLRHKLVTVPAQQTVTVPGRVRVKKPTIFGGQNTHTFTIAAQGTGAPEWVEGTLRSMPLFGKGLRTVVGLIAVVAVWAALAVVFIPKISDAVKTKNNVSSVAGANGAGAAGAGGAGGGAGAEGSGANGSGGPGGAGGAAGGGAGAGGGTGQPAGGYVVSGTVTGPGASGASVTLTPVSLAGAGDDGSLPAVQPGPGTSPKALRGGTSAFVNGVMPAAAGTDDGALGKIRGPLAGVAREGFRTTTLLTTDKGEFTFGGVTAPGYYLLTIGKAGFQTQRFLINSVNLAAPQPMKVALEPGTGKLSGSVTGPGGAVGAAQIVVTDGTVTLQTSSISASTHTGTPGTWTLDQVSTPGTYLVTASAPGLGSASKLVTLDAAGSAQVDLQLSAGQGSIVGTVTGQDSLGVTGGLGGITVTAKGGETTRTATTVTSAAMRGAFVLPNLPAPGDYTLTISGPGFLTQTRDVSLGASGGTVTVNATLSRADSVVSGMVTGLDANGKAEGGLGGVGLTLASNDITMKTMTTSGDSAGSYQFTGVVPGSYVLTAVQFGRVTASATVELAAASAQTVNLVMQADIGAELPATAHIRGQVVDSRSSGPLTCDRSLTTVSASDCVATVTVTAPKDPADSSKGTVTYTSTATAALNYVYTIPDLNDPDHAGLPPGLYTVTVKAPGYEDTITHVQVAQGQTMPAPAASMPPLGIISGTVTTRVGTPAKASCVLAVPTSVSLPKDLPTSCSVSTDGNTCTATGISGAQPCSLTSMGGKDQPPVGTFAVRGLTHGKYQMVLISQDPEYIYSVGTVPTVTLDLGADGQFNAVLDRLGRITVSVVELNPQSGALVPVEGASVTASKITGDGVATPAAVTSNADGIAILKGLNGTYKVTGSYTPTGATAPIVVDAQADPTGLNQDANVILVIAQQSGPIVGRVVVDSGGTTPIPVAGANVTVNGVVGYDAQGANIGSAQVKTDANGCYAIVPFGWSATDGAPKSPACPSGVTGSAVGMLKYAGQAAILISDRIDVAVDAVASLTAGTPLTNIAIADCASGCGSKGRIIPAIHVTALPMSAAGLVMTLEGPSGGFAPPATSAVSVNVLGKPTGTGTVKLTPAGSFVAGGGTYTVGLQFTDSVLNNAVNSASVGRYQLQVSATGFVTSTVDLLCTFAQPACIFTTPGTATPTSLALKRLPSISITLNAQPVSNQSATPWADASITTTNGSSLGALTVVAEAPDADGTLNAKVQFAGNDTALAAANATYSFTVSVPGYGLTTFQVTCGADYTSVGCSADQKLAALPAFDSAGSTVALSDATPPGSTTPFDFGAITATVSPNPTGSILVGVTQAKDADGNPLTSGGLTYGSVNWTDSRPGVLPGQVVAGTYTITYHLAGFADVTATLDCTASPTCTQSPAEVVLKMLPQPVITVTVKLPKATTDATVDVSHSTFTVYRVGSGGTLTRVSTAHPSMDTATVNTDGVTPADTATAHVSWVDSAQAFPGIAGLGTYRVDVDLDGYQRGTTTDLVCTTAGTTCSATVTLDTNPSGDKSIEKFPAGAKASLTVAGGPAGAAPVSLVDNGDGTLTWQQGNSPAGVVTPGGTYQITATLAGYVSSYVVDTNGNTKAASPILFTCNTGAGNCEFPTIVMTQSTRLVVLLKDDQGAIATSAALILGRVGASAGDNSSPTTNNGSATFDARSTSAVNTVSGTDSTYTLDVKAAGYAFFTGADLLTSGSTTDVTCMPGTDTAKQVTGLRLFPGGTTNCTVTLTKLGSITGSTSWQHNYLSSLGASTDTEAKGGINLKATLIATADGSPLPSPAPSFTATSADTASTDIAVGDFVITGSTTTAGLTPGTWQIDVTNASPGFSAFTGIVDIDASHKLVNSDPTKFTALDHLDTASGKISVVLTPANVNLSLTYIVKNSQIKVPDVTVSLTDNASTPTTWKCTVSKGSVTTDTTATPPTPTDACTITGSGNSQALQYKKLPPGAYKISMVFAGGQYNTVTDYSAIVAPTGAAQTLPFTLDAQSGTISGALADSAGTALTSFPAGAATVTLTIWGCTPLGDASCIAKDFTNQDVTVTTTNGKFSLTNLQNGDYRILVNAPGYALGQSDYVKVTIGTPTPAQTIKLRATAATSVKLALTLGGGADNALLNGASVTLKPSSQPRQKPNTELSGYAVAGDGSGVVNISTAVPSGDYEVVVTPTSAAIPYPLTSTGTLTIADTDDGKAVDTSSAPMALNTADVTLTVDWGTGGCAVPPADATTIPVSITNSSAAPVTWTALNAATVSGSSAATAVLLPPGDYQWKATAPTGWTAPTTNPSFTVADPAVVPTDGLTATLASATAPNFTATVNVDGTATSGATLSASSGAGSTSFTDKGDGTYTACLTGSTSPGTTWTVSLSGAAAGASFAGFSDVTVTVIDGSAPSPSAHTFDGYTLQPSVTLASGSPTGTDVTADISISGSVLLLPGQIVKQTTGWTGTNLIVPAGTYTLTATPNTASQTAGYGVGTGAGVTVGAGANGPKTITAEIPYTAPPPPTFGVIPTAVLDAASTGDPTGTTFTVTIAGQSSSGQFDAGTPNQWTGTSITLPAGTYTAPADISVTASPGTATITGALTVDSAGAPTSTLTIKIP